MTHRTVKDRQKSFFERRLKEETRIKQKACRNIDVMPSESAQYADAQKRKEHNIRAMPYPFNGMIAITSDIDRSNRDLFYRYITQMVKEYGLDFGDSVWLCGNHVGPNAGLSFLGPDMRIHANTIKQRITSDLTPYELAKEFHKGNIDHWHFFLTRGPRVILSKTFTQEKKMIRFFLPPEPDRKDMNPYFNIRPFPVFAAAVDASPAVNFKKLSVFVRKGADREIPIPFRKGDKGRFVILPEINSNTPVPMAIHITRIELAAENDIPALDDAGLYLFNTYSELLFHRLMYIRDRFGVYMNTATKHAAWHMDTKESICKINEMCRKWLKRIDVDRISFPGEIENQAFNFTTLGDHSNSFAYLFNPVHSPLHLSNTRIGASNLPDSVRHALCESGKFPNTSMLVYPILRKDGGVVFNMAATCSTTENTGSDSNRLSPSGVETFDAGMGQLMSWFQGSTTKDSQFSGKGIFFSTHLGNIACETMPKTPYLNPEILEKFSDCHYGKMEACRIWFTRASVLADFCKINQALIELADVDFINSRVDIVSADDPFTHSKIPSSSNQLYGQTFYVRDASSASIFLDGKEVIDIQRNVKKPGELSASVTIVDCGIRKVLFNDINPMLNRINECHGMKWEWIIEPAGLAFGRLCLDRDGSGYVLIDFSGTHLEAAQHLFYSLRRSDLQTGFGIEWQVTTGGLFYFGDEAAFPEGKNYTGYYLFHGRQEIKKEWVKYAIPFFDLTWSKAHECLTLPNHPLSQVKLILSGRKKCWIDLRLLELGRPRTTALYPGKERAIIGGTVPADAESVHLVSARTSVELHQTKVDDLCGFSFPNLPHGAYHIHVFDKENALIASQEIEVQSDRFDIEL